MENTTKCLVEIPIETSTKTYTPFLIRVIPLGVRIICNIFQWNWICIPCDPCTIIFDLVTLNLHEFDKPAVKNIRVCTLSNKKRSTTFL